jgi:hypothetical protein
VKTAGRLTGHFFIKRILSWRNAAFLLIVIGVLVAGVCNQAAFRQRIHSRVGAPLQGTDANEPFSAPLLSLHPGSSHLNVWEAVTGHLYLSESQLGGPLLLFRTMTPLLAFFLLLAGLLSAYDIVSRDIETRRLDSLLSMPVDRSVLGLSRAFGESLALTLTMAVGCCAALLTVSSMMDLHWTSEQLARAVAFLFLLGGYVFLFVLVGMWISAKARSSRQALWICAVVFISMFSFHVLVENAMAIDRADLPVVPEVPTEVSLYFRDAKAQAYPPVDELPEVVTAFFDELDAYSQALADTLRARYHAERWWSFVSPPALLIEVSGLLLQDQYYDVLDVFYSPTNPQRAASLAASIGQSAGEITWLIVLCGAFLGANIRVLTRLEV